VITREDGSGTRAEFETLVMEGRRIVASALVQDSTGTVRQMVGSDPAAIVATALFGDGAAAAVVTGGEHSLARIKGSAEKLWPDTQRIMGWDVEDPGLAVVFDRAIPPFIEAELAQAVDEMCAEMGVARGDIDRLCCHPGGVKVIDAIEKALDRNQGELNLERGLARRWQHECSDDPVRSGKAAQARPSQPRADDRLRPGIHLRRHAIGSCVRPSG
jgi:hypothetical protein